MEYYTLSRYAYWKYYILVLYYRLAEYPPVVRAWFLFGSICFILLVLIVVGNALRSYGQYRFSRLIKHNRKRYYERMKTVVSQARTLEPGEIVAILELPTKEKKDLTVLKIDVDEMGLLAARYGIQAIPTLLLFKNGQHIETRMGYQNKNQLLAFINQ